MPTGGIDEKNLEDFAKLPMVFACGGSVYTSVAEAARPDGKTIGVDSDQKEAFDIYAEGMAVTSALKNMACSLTRSSMTRLQTSAL